MDSVGAVDEWKEKLLPVFLELAGLWNSDIFAAVNIWLEAVQAVQGAAIAEGAEASAGDKQKRGVETGSADSVQSGAPIHKFGDNPGGVLPAGVDLLHDVPEGLAGVVHNEGNDWCEPDTRQHVQLLQPRGHLGQLPVPLQQQRQGHDDALPDLHRQQGQRHSRLARPPQVPHSHSTAQLQHRVGPHPHPHHRLLRLLPRQPLRRRRRLHFQPGKRKERQGLPPHPQATGVAQHQKVLPHFQAPRPPA